MLAMDALHDERVLISLVVLAFSIVAIAVARRILSTKRVALDSSDPSPAAHAANPLRVFFASQKGHARRFAARLVDSARERGIEAVAVDIKGYDPDRLVEHRRAVFIVATYTAGSAVPGTDGFFHEVAEMSRDFRVEKSLLEGLAFAVFGCGNSEYPRRHFNAVARRG